MFRDQRWLPKLRKDWDRNNVELRNPGKSLPLLHSLFSNNLFLGYIEMWTLRYHSLPLSTVEPITQNVHPFVQRRFSQVALFLDKPLFVRY